MAEGDTQKEKSLRIEDVVKRIKESFIEGAGNKVGLERNLMEYLTVVEIIEIHDEIIKRYGGTGGIRDEGTLQLLVYKMNREKDVFKRAALAMHMIADAGYCRV